MPTGLFFPIIQGTRPTLDLKTKKVMDGLHWTAPHTVSVGTGTAVTVLIEVPAAGIYHLAGSVQIDKGGTWNFTSGPTCSAGTAMTAYNNNRRATNTTNLTLSHTVSSYSTMGTALMPGTMASGSSPMSITGEFANETDWILATSGTYLIRLVAGGAASNAYVVLRYWKES